MVIFLKESFSIKGGMLVCKLTPYSEGKEGKDRPLQMGGAGGGGSPGFAGGTFINERAHSPGLSWAATKVSRSPPFPHHHPPNFNGLCRDLNGVSHMYHPGGPNHTALKAES